MDKQGKLAIVSAIFLVAIMIASFVMAGPSKACRDGVDNDGDGLVDLNDPGCSDSRDVSELNSAIECDDGIDNDGDGLVDSADGGCSGATDNDESNCGDGVCEGTESSSTCTQDCGYPDSCTDTDLGDMFTYGITSGYNNNVPFSVEDVCLDNMTLLEFGCGGTQLYNFTTGCQTNFSTSCYQGACI